MEIIKSLSDSAIISSFDILEMKTFHDGFYVKVKATLKDNSELFIREYLDDKNREYSYHWQSENKEKYIRWDNSPHHNSLETFPHHKHIDNLVLPSNEISVEDILLHLSNVIKLNG